MGDTTEGTSSTGSTETIKQQIAELAVSNIVSETEASVSAMLQSVLSAAGNDISALSQNLSTAAAQNPQLQSLTAAMIAQIQARVKATLPDDGS